MKEMTVTRFQNVIALYYVIVYDVDFILEKNG